jgi:glycosyltransferase involved in cell wall biosynthesis
MKIIHIIGKFDIDSGGAQKIIARLCEKLPEKHFKQEVIYFFGQASLANELPKSVTVHHLSKLLKLQKLIKTIKPDIVHIHSPIAGLVGRPVVWINRIPCITTIHNTNYKLKNILVEVATLPLSNVIVGVSNSVTRNCQELIFWRKTKIHFQTIHNGINLKQFEPDPNLDYLEIRNEVGLSKSDFLIGLVGRLNEQKGSDIAIKSIARIKNYLANAKLVLVGRGNWLSYLNKLARKYNVSDKVIFLGGRDDVERFYPIFDICIFPSRWEGFGLAPVEAMAAARTVIASDIPPFREVIAEGGEIVPCTVEAFADKIIQLNKTPERCQALSKLAQQRASLFSVEKMAKAYSNLYSSLL